MNQAVIERLRGELTGLREQGLYKSERVLAGPQGGVVRAGERDVINLCANNYLGLANHAVVRAAAQRAIDEYGYGMASVRFICGTQGTHKGLEQCLRQAQGARTRLIATDGVFSMDGFIASLREICELAARYDALVMVDDSHGTGFMGATGRGTPEHCGVAARVDILTGTLGKALGGGSGGYVAARREVIEWLRPRSRPYLLSNSIPPVVAAASLAVLELLEHTPQLRAQLFENTRLFRTGLTKAGFDLKPGEHPIIPVMLGDAALAGRMADRLLERGVYVVGFSYPVVPKGQARIRTQMSAALTREQLERAVDAFTSVGR